MVLTHKERFILTAERKAVDRPASWLGVPTMEQRERLFLYYKCRNMRELKYTINDDIYSIEVPRFSIISSDSCNSLILKEKQNNHVRMPDNYYAKGSDEFDLPNPEDYIDASTACEMFDEIPANYATVGIIWSAHFQNTCDIFGMENALCKMILEPEIFSAAIDRITDFHLKANEIFYNAVEHRMDAVFIGNDIGTQRGLIISPEMFRRFVLPGTEKLIAQAHSHGYKVIYHSCGSIYDIIPDLINADADIIHPAQALAKSMDCKTLKDAYSGKISFCGGIDIQNLLPNGKPEEIIRAINQIKELFPTGFIISPSHESLFSDIPPKNIDIMFNAINAGIKTII